MRFGFPVIFWLLSHGVIPSCLGYRIQSVPGNDEMRNVLEYSDEVVANNFPSLKVPDILSRSTTPIEFLNEEFTNSFHQIMIGIVVENYSKFRLIRPRSSGQTHCSHAREIRPPQNVDGGAFEMFVADNMETYHRGVCGTLEWTMGQANGETLFDQTKKFGYKLITTYHVPYTGSCGTEDGRNNVYTVQIAKVKVNSTGHLEHPGEFRGYFETFHTQSPSGKGWLYSDKGNVTVLAMYDEKRFLIRSNMDKGCKPLLTIQLMPGPDFAETLMFRSQTIRQEEAQKLVDEWVTSTTPTTALVSSGGGLGRLTTLAIIFVSTVLLIIIISSILIVAFVRRKRSKDRRFRRPYGQ